MINGKEKFSRFCAGAVLILSLCFMLFLLVSAFISTTGMSTGGGEGEVVTFLSDDIFLNIVITLLMLAALYLLLRLFENVPLKITVTVLLGWTLIFGGAFVCSGKLQPSNDSYIVTFFARQAAGGDFSYYNEYFRFFPFQFGFVLYEEIFFRIFGTLFPNAPEGFSALALQLLNVLYTACAYLSLIKICGLLFGSVRLQKLTAVMLFFCVQPVLFCTFIYGNTPAFCFACLGLWMFLLFQKENKTVFALLCCLCIALAVLLKLNALIYFTAIAIVWLICVLRAPSFRSALCLVLLAALVLAVKPLPQKYYEARSGVSFGSGIPQWGWMAMGMHEGESCSGWYGTEFTTTEFIKNAYDPNATADHAKAAILKRFGEFRDSPSTAARFFGRKFLSQWNEPSYQSLWTNQSRPSYSSFGSLYKLLCVDRAAVLAGWMNYIQQLVLLGFTVSLLLLFRKRDILTVLLPLVIFGAMLYHLLFEAKSQQSMGYFVLMIPLAAYGINGIFTRDRERN